MLSLESTASPVTWKETRTLISSIAVPLTGLSFSIHIYDTYNRDNINL